MKTRLPDQAATAHVRPKHSLAMPYRARHRRPFHHGGAWDSALSRLANLCTVLGFLLALGLAIGARYH